MSYLEPCQQFLIDKASSFFQPGSDHRLNDVSPASTSGSGSQDLRSCICNQNLELDAFIRLQNQKLKEAVEESRKTQLSSLVQLMEQGILRKFEETETELEKVKRLNQYLEEKVKQMSDENQMWFNMAKNNEVTVMSLRQSLEQLLFYKHHAIEGFGETDDKDVESPLIQSEEYWEEKNQRRKAVTKSCKGCGGGHVSALVLPCRHLCLCKDCELLLDCCPVCNSIKKATLQVLFS